MFSIAIGAWLVIGARRKREASQGGSVEISLHRRWLIIVQRILGSLAVVLLTATVTLALAGSLRLDDAVKLLFTFAWVIILPVAIRRSSTLIIGGGGLLLNGRRLVQWPQVARIDWDRDIGQQQWGWTLVARIGKREVKQRLYLLREHKEKAEAALRRFQRQSDRGEDVLPLSATHAAA